ncbi:MAG: hypothetical protein PVH42_14625 [Desulfobacterales bacterium]
MDQPDQHERAHLNEQHSYGCLHLIRVSRCLNFWDDLAADQGTRARKHRDPGGL